MEAQKTVQNFCNLEGRILVSFQLKNIVDTVLERLKVIFSRKKHLVNIWSTPVDHQYFQKMVFLLQKAMCTLFKRYFGQQVLTKY